MLRFVGLPFLWLACVVALAPAAPARLPYEPGNAPKMPARATPNLSGTAWLGKYLSANRIFIFEADGTLSYKTTTATAKAVKNKGSWKVEGDRLYFEYFITPTQKRMEFRGTITEGNTIVGEASYPANGTKVQQTLQRSFLEIK